VHRGAHIAIQFALEYVGLVRVLYERDQSARMIHGVQNPGPELSGARSNAEKGSSQFGRCKRSGDASDFGWDLSHATIRLQRSANAQSGGARISIEVEQEAELAGKVREIPAFRIGSKLRGVR